ncbi:MAG: hypothetical protein O2840_03745 [bacterium]|nr:hypothetical protein [bacterium]
MGENKKAFFSTSPKALSLYPSVFARIYKTLHLLPIELTEAFLEKTTVETITNWKSAHKDTFYRASLTGITDSDICVFEATHPSLTLAHFIKHSLDQDKPTVVLHQEHATPFLLEETGIVGPLLFEYEGVNLEQVLKSAIKEALEQPDAIRFNCLISAELNRYITQAAKAEQRSKSEFFRKLVRDHQERNKR